MCFLAVPSFQSRASLFCGPSVRLQISHLDPHGTLTVTPLSLTPASSCKGPVITLGLPDDPGQSSYLRTFTLITPAELPLP